MYKFKNRLNAVKPLGKYQTLISEILCLGFAFVLDYLYNIVIARSERILFNDVGGSSIDKTSHNGELLGRLALSTLFDGNQSTIMVLSTPELYTYMTK